MSLQWVIPKESTPEVSIPIILVSTSIDGVSFLPRLFKACAYLCIFEAQNAVAFL